MKGGTRVLLGTWIAALILVGYRSFHSGQGMPTPRSLIAANVVWSILAMVSLASEQFAGALSVGTLTALLVTNSSVLGEAATSVAKTSGQTTAQAASPAIGNVVSGVNS